jgi:hypothetical protein
MNDLEKLLKQLAEAERLLRAIRNDWQAAHWHKDIDKWIKENL